MLIPVPSQQPVYLSEILRDETPGSLWLRFRFVAPNIGHGGNHASPSQSALDMDHLCQSVAMDYVVQHQIQPERISIALSDRVTEFGVSNRAATQFFELYSLENATCIWEGL